MAKPIEFFYRAGTFSRMGTIGSRIRKLRLEKKLTQPQLAALVGIDQSTLSDIERGASIRAEVLIRLAEALDVTPEFIVRGIQTIRWPFSIEYERFERLTDKQKGIVEGKLEAAIEQYEHEPDPGSAAEEVLKKRIKDKLPPLKIGRKRA